MANPISREVAIIFAVIMIPVVLVFAFDYLGDTSVVDASTEAALDSTSVGINSALPFLVIVIAFGSSLVIIEKVKK